MGELRSAADIGKYRLGQCRQAVGCQRDFQATSPGADMDLRILARTLVNEGTQALLLPQRTDPPQQVAGSPLRGLRVGHLHALDASGQGQRLEVQAAGHRHHSHQQFVALTARQQGLEHLGRVKSQLVSRFQAVGSTLRVMFVAEHLVGDSSFFQHIDSGRHGSDL